MVARYAIIAAGVVTNAVLAEANYAADRNWIVLPDGFGPGDLYDGAVWTKSGPPDYSALDLDALNAALAQPGSVVRALVLVMLQEINKLRQNAGLATYTQAQFVQALKAQMR